MSDFYYFHYINLGFEDDRVIEKASLDAAPSIGATV